MRPNDETNGAGGASEERRQQIMNAALKLFATRGVMGTKMSMIAAEAGISQGLSYRYFGSKDELLTRLVHEALEGARVAVAKLSAFPGSPREQFAALTRTMLDKDHRLHFLLIQQAQAAEKIPDQVKQLLAQYSSEEMLRFLVPVFEKGQQLGEFCEGEPYRLLLLYFSVIAGLMLQEAPPEGHWDNEVDLLMKILTR